MMFDILFFFCTAARRRGLPCLLREKKTQNFVLSALCVLCGKIENKKATESVFSVAFWVVYILLD